MENTETEKKEKLKLIAMGVLGILTGLLIMASVMVFRLNHFSVKNPNGWVTGEGVGSRDADLITRAIVSKIGIFANSRDQAVYFSSSLGKTMDLKKLLPVKEWFSLDSQNHYQIKGNVNMPASWWSITLYNNRDFLVANTENRFSFTNFNLKTDQDGNFKIDIAPKRPSDVENWLPAPENGSFNLKMRIYEPSKQIYDNFTGYPLPKLEEVQSL